MFLYLGFDEFDREYQLAFQEIDRRGVNYTGKYVSKWL